MHLHRPTMIRTLLVPGLVLLLGIGSVVSITDLQSTARASAHAELNLARMQISLYNLEGAPFRTSRSLNGSPAIARGLIAQGKAEVNGAMADLRRNSPAQALRRLSSLVVAHYALIDRIYRVGVAEGLNDGTQALAAQTAAQLRQIIAQMSVAGAAYHQQARTADRRTTEGSAAVILLLVLGFGFLYRRSVAARLTAEGLVAENGRLLESSRVEALTDSLSALANRRALRLDLDAILARNDGDQEHVLALLDLDGFKHYNDTFGHLAGDTLLVRLGTRVAAAMQPPAKAYRMGGDEFCVLAPVGPGGGEALVRNAAAALSEDGDAFSVGCSYGWARIPSEATTAESALRLVDQRMYAHKVGRSTTQRQSSDVLLRVLSECNPGLHDHISSVAEMAELVARKHGLADLDVQWVRLAAELHDVGKVAVPDAILDKPGPLTAEEWTFMRRHTLIGERIIGSAPSLAPAAALVRSSHEHYDGGGYPDGLRAEQIDVGARIIAICDAYDAMVAERVYREPRSREAALAELRACAGAQFDPALVELFCSTLAERAEAPLMEARASAR